MGLYCNIGPTKQGTNFQRERNGYSLIQSRSAQWPVAEREGVWTGVITFHEIILLDLFQGACLPMNRVQTWNDPPHVGMYPTCFCFVLSRVAGKESLYKLSLVQLDWMWLDKWQLTSSTPLLISGLISCLYVKKLFQMEAFSWQSSTLNYSILVIMKLG